MADLRNTQLADGIDSFVARRAKAASMGNVHLLDSLIQQLHVPPADCRDVGRAAVRREARLPGRREVRAGPAGEAAGRPLELATAHGAVAACQRNKPRLSDRRAQLVPSFGRRRRAGG